MLPTPEIVGADYDRIYDPAEDSFLLLDLFESLKKYLDCKVFLHRTPLVVELGTGTGIVSTFINRHILPNACCIATDINPYSCKTALQTNTHNATSFNFDVIRCDLSSALRNGQIDLLVFNPPYVPTEDVPAIPETTDQEDTWVDIALNGGPQGMDVTNRVLDQLDTILSPDGEAYILFCARNNPELVSKKFVQDHHNFVVQKVIHRKAGWEELSIYRYHKLP